jgi:hypothetical protein
MLIIIQFRVPYSVRYRKIVRYVEHRPVFTLLAGLSAPSADTNLPLLYCHIVRCKQLIYHSSVNVSVHSLQLTSPVSRRLFITFQFSAPLSQTDLKSRQKYLALLIYRIAK